MQEQFITMNFRKTQLDLLNASGIPKVPRLCKDSNSGEIADPPTEEMRHPDVKTVNTDVAACSKDDESS
jgi:hypothetical protein